MREIKCEDCPLSWEECSYEGECSDCGCLVYGDLYEGDKAICHFPERIKQFIADRKQKHIDRQQAHQYDGICEWYEAEQKKDTAFRQAIEEHILHNHYGDTLYLCTEDKDGKLYKYELGIYDVELARERYEELLKESEG